MKFDEFLKNQTEYQKAVSYKPGHPAYIDTVRLYNGLASIFPDMFDEIVELNNVGDGFKTVSNPFRKNKKK